MTAGQDALAEIARSERARVLAGSDDSAALAALERAAAENERDVAGIAGMLRRGCYVRTIAARTGVAEKVVLAIASTHDIKPRRDPQGQPRRSGQRRRHLAAVRDSA